MTQIMVNNTVNTKNNKSNINRNKLNKGKRTHKQQKNKSMVRTKKGGGWFTKSVDYSNMPLDQLYLQLLNIKDKMFKNKTKKQLLELIINKINGNKFSNMEYKRTLQKQICNIPDLKNTDKYTLKIVKDSNLCDYNANFKSSATSELQRRDQKILGIF